LYPIIKLLCDKQSNTVQCSALKRKSIVLTVYYFGTVCVKRIFSSGSSPIVQIIVSMLRFHVTTRICLLIGQHWKFTSAKSVIASCTAPTSVTSWLWKEMSTSRSY